MPDAKVTLGVVTVGAIGMGYVAYKFSVFKKNYQRAKEEAKQRRIDNWNSFVSGAKVTAFGACVLMGITGYYSLRKSNTDS